MLRISPASGAHGGYDFVDLGLRVKWATLNVGANSREDFGDYFAWGETKVKDKYRESTRTTVGRKADSIDCNAARANWGGSWRLPTQAEWVELLNNCSREWGTLNGVAGILFTSRKNGNNLFLPAAGRRIGSSLYGAREYGRYWSSTIYGGRRQEPCGLYFEAGGSAGIDGYNGHDGYPVRPVLE